MTCQDHQDVSGFEVHSHAALLQDEKNAGGVWGLGGRAKLLKYLRVLGHRRMTRDFQYINSI
ncbi:hypothetical protein PHLCEN_2v5962 [Hermanssonia centrifuga]|uniref:Uncharacterized protein n=1 Tax=Hermanssonia centrifuga TaxID=98765 RepID=A0A2R6P0V5_9APHY|nr:hypothetical protein PHLCEN_2v5962 [Hermanssonia centrifuga]